NGVGIREPRIVFGELLAVGVRAAAGQGPAEAPGLSREVVVLTQRPAAVVEQIAGAKPSPAGILEGVVGVGQVRRGVEHQEPPCRCRARPPATPMVTARPNPLPARTHRVAQYWPPVPAGLIPSCRNPPQVLGRSRAQLFVRAEAEVAKSSFRERSAGSESR